MGPLQGLKVVDLTSMVSGPVAAMMLADQGAAVVKVSCRRANKCVFSVRQRTSSAAFFSCNRGKTSLALDLKAEAGAKFCGS